MKKSMLFASILAMTITGEALALSATGRRFPLVSGSSAGMLLFSRSVTARAPSAGYPLGACDYTAFWYGDDTRSARPQTCVFHEPKQPFFGTCLSNRRLDFFTAPLTAGITTTCGGYDAAGNPFDVGIIVYAAELPMGVFGIVMYPSPGFPEPIQL